MEKNNLWMTTRIAGVNIGTLVRVCLMLMATVGGVVIALTSILSFHVATHASSVQTGALPGPVSKSWYFAEGRVGAGYAENLTIKNPDSTHACAVNVQYIYQPDGGSSTTKKVAVSIAATTRVSESANTDLNIMPNQTSGAWVAATITVNSSLTSACTGVVAERSVYFNANGVNSGTEVVGSTHLGTTFYFADMSTGTGYTSDIAILNTNSGAAKVTINYYAGGQPVGSQSATVNALTRSTLTPLTSLPSHVTAAITSNLPVLVERSNYFNAIKAGSAGTVSGGWSTIGSQTLANDWLFAQGYTSGKFQEYLDIANLDPANQAAAVTISLIYPKGAPLTFTAKVNPHSQLIWDVNQNGMGGVSPHVSAEVTSTGAKIVVERQMFFKYNHTVNGSTVIALGGTDVMGQVGPASQIQYNFADGNTNPGYDELLVLLNPTTGSEKVYPTLVNGLGVVYHMPAIRLYPKTNVTIDITAVVAKNMVKPGDGEQAYEVSMKLIVSFSYEGFVAERLNYWNASTAGLTNATQGGTDVIGYSGL
ncbi:MAG: hypothetical protein NVSMB33_13370 [Ktedonobacteraceae bacterium]